MVQVSIAAAVPSIAALALHKWLQDLHHVMQTDGPACLRKRIVLLIGHWTVTPPQSPDSTPSRGDTAPQVSPEEEQPSTSQAAHADEGGMPSGAGPSSPGSRAARSRSPARGQKRMTSSLPAVAAKIFGPGYDEAANQAAILAMVRGFDLPFRYKYQQHQPRVLTSLLYICAQYI